MCDVEEFHTLAMFVWFCVREAKSLLDKIGEVNCHNWPIVAYIRSWYTGMRYWRQCLQAPLPGLSPVRTQVSLTFCRSVSLLSWSLEQATLHWIILSSTGTEDEDADNDLRRFAVNSYVDLLEKPVLPDILIRVICWVSFQWTTLLPYKVQQ